MLPWFFALDKVNYARYLSIYYKEMVALPDTHPSTHKQLLSGKFYVQRQANYGFSSVPCDQAIEPTINKEAKSKAGWRGFSLKRNAVCRWIMSSHSRGRMTEQCATLAGESKEEKSSRKELKSSEVKKHEDKVAAIKAYLGEHINPFDVECPSLINISSGAVAQDEVARDLSTAQQTGEAHYTNFVQERLVEKKESVFTHLKTLKLKTFCNNNTKNISKTAEKKRYSDSHQQTFVSFADHFPNGRSRHERGHELRTCRHPSSFRKSRWINDENEQSSHAAGDHQSCSSRAGR